MRPDGRAFRRGADEVRMVLRDPPIVNGFDVPAVGNTLDRHEFIVARQQDVAHLQQRGRNPATAFGVERVLRSGADDLAGDMKIQDWCNANKDFFYFSQSQRAAWVKFTS